MNKSIFRLLIFLADLVVAVLAILGTKVLTSPAVPVSVWFRSIFPPAVLLIFSWVAALYIQGLYYKAPTHSRLLLAYLVFRCVVVGSVAAIFLTYWAAPTWLEGRLFYLLSTAIMTVGTVGMRLWLQARIPEYNSLPRVLFVGNTGLKRIAVLRRNLDDSVRGCLVGYVAIEAPHGNDGPDPPLPQAGHLDDLEQIIEGNDISHIALCDQAPTPAQLRKILSTSALHDVEVTTLEDVFMRLTEQAPLLEMDAQYDLQPARDGRSFYAGRLKRLVDVGASLAVLPFALPLMGLAAVAIKLTSPGPVFYRQQRVGSNSTRFLLTKLRTMTQDAEKDTGAVWATEDDPRVTPVGRILRKTRIDELPQFFNVLKGEMSLIGPRPERPKFVEQFNKTIPMYDRRYSVQPGITGWAQVNQGYDTCEEDVFRKLRYDLFYIHNMSFGLDFRIMLRTIFVMLRAWGAY